MRQLITLVVVVLALAGCGHKPDPAACEQAMRKQLASATAAGGNATHGTKPPECDGLSDAQLQKLGEKVLGDQMGGGTTAP